MPNLNLVISSLDEVAALARGMTQLFPIGITFGLIGTLGAGKTTFVQAIAGAAGIDTADVTSPTFTLLNSYDAQISAGNISLHHLDVYRINDDDEFLELGVEELFEQPNAWTLIEWADRVELLMPRNTVWIYIDFQSAAVMPGSHNEDSASPRVIRIVTEYEPLTAPLNQLSEWIKSSQTG